MTFKIPVLWIPEFFLSTLYIQFYSLKYVILKNQYLWDTRYMYVYGKCTYCSESLTKHYIILGLLACWWEMCSSTLFTEVIKQIFTVLLSDVHCVGVFLALYIYLVHTFFWGLFFFFFSALENTSKYFLMLPYKL